MTDERIKELANKWCLHPTDNAWDEVMGFAYDLLAEKQEPLCMDISRMPTEMPDWKPGMVLPLPKREWAGLTDEEIETIVNNNTYDDSGYDIWCHGKGIARDIEAKLKEKNI